MHNVQDMLAMVPLWWTKDCSLHHLSAIVIPSVFIITIIIIIKIITIVIIINIMIIITPTSSKRRLMCGVREEEEI